MFSLEIQLLIHLFLTLMVELMWADGLSSCPKTSSFGLFIFFFFLTYDVMLSLPLWPIPFLRTEVYVMLGTKAFFVSYLWAEPRRERRE